MKECVLCKQTKDESEYYKHALKDGTVVCNNSCCACHNERRYAKTRKQNKLNPFQKQTPEVQQLIRDSLLIKGGKDFSAYGIKTHQNYSWKKRGYIT